MRQTYFRRLAGQGLVLAAIAATLLLLTVKPDEAQTTTQPTGSGRQPIVENQFTTTGGGALQARAPGLYTSQAIAIQEGTFDPFDGNVPDNTPWVRETFDQLFLQFVGIIQDLVDLLNVAAGGDPLGGLLDGLTGGTGNPLSGLLSNPLTTNPGGSTPIN